MSDMTMVEKAARAIEAEAVGKVDGKRLRQMLAGPISTFDKIDVWYCFAGFHDERDARKNWWPTVRAALADPPASGSRDEE